MGCAVRNCDDNNVLSDTIVAHSILIQMMRTWPLLLSSYICFMTDRGTAVAGAERSSAELCEEPELLRELARPMNEQNPAMKVPSRNLKMPPDAESPGFPREAPSMVKTTGARPSCFHRTIVQHFTAGCLKVEGRTERGR
ncbi:hypothetical protein M9H77_13177 [Catharanthus roseus]|uniref:Uncharacterized protein n=1 Tax=Catharanthus roseus TaxID=4058 RepID=A0ACC0BJL0_CATRO|nr:hypothetical protein M9H77_13177 [Catharanthus roseus]